MIYQAGYEVKPDLTDEKMSKKIAQAFAEKYNFVLVVGQQRSQLISAIQKLFIVYNSLVQSQLKVDFEGRKVNRSLFW
ncbi:Threonyl-tRNA_synthetase [Hexamita inflata]|uniref:Threonyl-tRNA synthetase n=1 Tax=Hexamita inflata TaxID=28002 RepID=A0AA86QAA8_9EUKA|nr:Threonyl-tRNA synthetase [Hexamita inflata]